MLIAVYFFAHQTKYHKENAMANDYTILNIGTGGDAMDEEGVSYGSSPTTRKRARVQICGSGQTEVGRVIDSDPDGTEYGVVTRNVPSGTQNVLSTTPGTQICSFDQVEDIAEDTPTDVVTYTVPGGKTFHLAGIVVGGNGDANFSIYLGATQVALLRNTTAALTQQLHFDKINPTSAAGSVVRVEVVHTNEGITCNFESTLLGWIS
jgi:hypothetical protein